LPIALVVSATILAHAAFNGSRLTISLAALALGESALTVGILVSLFSALADAARPRAGRLVDRVGIRRPLLVASPAHRRGAAARAVAHIGGALRRGRGRGTAFMLFHICIQHFVGSASTEETRMNNFAGWRSPSRSRTSSAHALGLSIDHFGHRVTFCLPRALGGERRPRSSLFHARASRTSPIRAPTAEKRSALDLLANAELRRVFIVTGLLASAWDLFVFVMPIYGTSIGLSASTIGLFSLLRRRRLHRAPVAPVAFAARARVADDHDDLRRVVRRLRALPDGEGGAAARRDRFLLGLGLGATQPRS
jgi:hypothetical protein